MARTSLSKSAPKLNLSRRQVDLCQRIILIGNHMADAIQCQNKGLSMPAGTEKLPSRWGNLMVELVEMLF